MPQNETTSLNMEPAQRYLSDLVRICTNTHDLIYENSGTTYHILDALEGIIAFLDIESKNNLKNTLHKIRTLQDNPHNISASGREYKDVYSEIMNYLLKTYFQNMRFAKPKYEKKGFLGVNADKTGKKVANPLKK